jgi:hypothetical protein
MTRICAMSVHDPKRTFDARGPVAMASGARKAFLEHCKQETARKGTVLCTSMVLPYRYLSAPTRRKCRRDIC